MKLISYDLRKLRKSGLIFDHDCKLFLGKASDF